MYSSILIFASLHGGGGGVEVKILDCILWKHFGLALLFSPVHVFANTFLDWLATRVNYVEWEMLRCGEISWIIPGKHIGLESL